MAVKDLRSVDLNLLKALDALLLERSVTRAAARLSVTQPTMSASLKRLRVLFEDEVLVRDDGAMRPTPLAVALEAPVRQILALAESTINLSAHFDPSRDERSFSILATEFPALVALAPLAAALRHEAPGVQIEVVSARASTMSEHRALEQADLAIVPEPVAAQSGLPSEELFTDRFVATVWRRNDQVQDRMTRADFERLPYLAMRQDGQPSLADRKLTDLGVPVRPALVVGSFVVGAFMLAGTNTFTFLQESLVERLRPAADIRSIAADVQLPTITEFAVWHPRHSDDPAHQWLRERLAAHLPKSAAR